MTDNGRAALAAALVIPYPDDQDAGDCAMCGEPIRVESVKEFAAAILGERGVFLPDGLPEVSIKGLLEDFDGAPYPEDFQRAVAVREADYLGQIATLRVALVREVAELEKPTELHDYRQGFHRSPDCPGCMMLARLRAALAGADRD